MYYNNTRYKECDFLTDIFILVYDAYLQNIRGNTPLNKALCVGIVIRCVLIDLHVRELNTATIANTK
jgi:hypothetical protein